jgi:hypothetical protein
MSGVPCAHKDVAFFRWWNVFEVDNIDQAMSTKIPPWPAMTMLTMIASLSVGKRLALWFGIDGALVYDRIEEDAGGRRGLNTKSGAPAE